jgi:hypothetical protein
MTALGWSVRSQVFLHFCEVTQKCQNFFADEWPCFSPKNGASQRSLAQSYSEGRETGKPVVEAVNFKEIGERLGSQV